MNFLRNCWYVAGFTSEMSSSPIARTLLGEPVVMYRKTNGDLVAMDNRCAHRLAPLDRGSVVGDDIQCPYHGLRFGPDGACVKLPSGGLAPPRAKLRVYPVVERHAMVWIWMGETEAADPATICDFSSIENPEYGWFDGYLHAKANYKLFIDNLLDLSHAEFLHPLLSSAGWTSRNEQALHQDADTIFIDNVALDDNILPLMARFRPDMAKTGTTTQTERWSVPSLIELSVKFDDGRSTFELPSAHFLTPETERTTHYFVRGGQALAPHDEALNAGMKEGVLAIFRHEDIPMIEAQQINLGDDDLMEHDPAILKNDAGSTRARRILKKRIKDEQNTRLRQLNVA